jgi:hypothetical protein
MKTRYDLEVFFLECLARRETLVIIFDKLCHEKEEHLICMIYGRIATYITNIPITLEKLKTENDKRLGSVTSTQRTQTLTYLNSSRTIIPNF